MIEAKAQYPETWRRHEKRLCDTCWATCCTLPVEARPHDIARLGLATPEELEWDVEEVARRLIRERIVHAYDARSGMFILEQVAGRDCIFLDREERRCTVYERRPDTCRNFPRIGPRTGFCPYRER